MNPQKLKRIFQQNVDRENSNKVKQEEGVLSVARIKAQARTVRTPSLPLVHFTHLT